MISPSSEIVLILIKLECCEYVSLLYVRVRFLRWTVNEGERPVLGSIGAKGVIGTTDRT